MKGKSCKKDSEMFLFSVKCFLVQLKNLVKALPCLVTETMMHLQLNLRFNY